MYNNYIHLYIIMLYIIANKIILLQLYKSWIIHHFFITTHNLSHHPSQYLHDKILYIYCTCVLESLIECFWTIVEKNCTTTKVEETLVPTHFHITFLYVKVSNMCKVMLIGESHSQKCKARLIYMFHGGAIHKTRS
jgi:hypothetical protein